VLGALPIALGICGGGGSKAAGGGNAGGGGYKGASIGLKYQKYPVMSSGGGKVVLTSGPSPIRYKMGLTLYIYIYLIQIIFFKNRMYTR